MLEYWCWSCAPLHSLDSLDPARWFTVSQRTSRLKLVFINVTTISENFREVKLPHPVITSECILWKTCQKEISVRNVEIGIFWLCPFALQFVVAWALWEDERLLVCHFRKVVRDCVIQSHIWEIIYYLDLQVRRGRRHRYELYFKFRIRLLLHSNINQALFFCTYEIGPWQWEAMASTSLGGATSLQR